MKSNIQFRLLLFLILVFCIYWMARFMDSYVPVPQISFVKIPGGWFYKPKNIKHGYDIDSVFIPTFFITKENVTTSYFNSLCLGVLSSKTGRDNNGFIDELDEQSILDFIVNLNESSKDQYRIPSDLEWMRAYQYLAEIQQEGSFLDGPEVLCYWVNPLQVRVGDTLKLNWWVDEKKLTKSSLISKGNLKNLYNRDTSVDNCGIRLVLIK